MRTIITMLMTMFISASAISQTIKNYNLKDFNSISITGGTNITIVQGKKYEVRAEYNLQEGKDPIIQKSGNLLVIKNQGKNSKPQNGSYYLNLYITMPELKDFYSKGSLTLHLAKMEKLKDVNLKSSGAATIRIDELKCKNLTINQNGATTMEGNIICDNIVDINTNGAGKYTFEIIANLLSMSSNGAAEIYTSFKGYTCSVQSNGNSKIDLSAECSSLSCTSHGASKISVSGTADVTEIKSNGASSINTSRLNQF